MTGAERAAIHELMVRFAEGDRSAFDPLFAALWPAVRSFVTRSLPAADADDAAQEAIVKVFARCADFDVNSDAVAWALTIATFEVMTARRRHARRREAAAEPDGFASDERSPESNVAARELVAALESYLGDISASDRAAIEAEFRGESVSGEAARKRRWRALDRLRRYWRTRHG